MKTLTIALGMALLATGGAAAAQSASDAQCIIVSNAFAGQSKDAEQKQAAQYSMYFYLGRVSGTMTAAQLKTLLDAQMKTITNANASDTMNKCFATIQSRVQLLETVGKSASPAPAATPAKPGQPHR